MMLAEANVLGWVIAGVIILMCISRVMNSVTKTAWKIQGKGNCAFCGARLKSLASTGRGYGYADHCHRCGRQQPWTQQQQPWTEQEASRPSWRCPACRVVLSGDSCPNDGTTRMQASTTHMQAVRSVIERSRAST